MFYVLHGRNRVYILLVTSANEYPFCFEAKGCGPEACRAFIIARLPASGRGGGGGGGGRRSLSASARKSNGPSGCRLNTKLYRDVLVLRSTFVL